MYLSEIPCDEPPRLFGDEPDVLKLSRVGELLGCDAKTVRREIQRGRLQAFKVGNSHRVTKRALLRYVGEGE